MPYLTYSEMIQSTKLSGSRRSVVVCSTNLEIWAVINLYWNFLGAVAQLGERDVRNVEARGSIPLSSI
jgi:hypothetical protein